MNSKHFYFTAFLIVIFLVSGCNSSTEQESPMIIASQTAKPNNTPIPPTNTSTLFPTITALPSTNTPTLFPTITALPPVTISFYHLRIEYTSTSDWATLEFRDPEAILTTQVVSVTGTPTTAEASSASIQLLRPFEALSSEPTVSMIVDLAFDPDFINQPLVMLSRHGGIGGSGIRVSYLGDQETVLLSDIDHYWVDLNNPGSNDTSFEVDLTPLSNLSAANRQLIRIAPPKMLWAFYYPWIAWDQDASCTDHPSIPYDYNDDGSRTSETFARQIEQAQSAGIDGFIVSWVDNETLNHNLSLLLDAAQEKGFFIAIYLESTPDPNDRTVHPDIITDWLAYAIPEFGDHPAYMQLNGKPLIVVYNSGAAPLETWQTMFADLDARGDFASYMGMSYNLTDLSLFDGLHQYSILGIPDLSSVYQSTSREVRYYPLLQGTDQQKIFAATVQAGFDDCPYHPPTTDLLEERDNGDYYRSTFEAAIQSNPDWIIITSWNEFGETTHIEPSGFYGTQYLDITREYAERWKNP
jgi:hypothetical protein